MSTNLVVTKEVTYPEYRLLLEICRDALASARLSVWEDGFLASLRKKLNRYHDQIALSEAQWRTIRQIETKLYAS